MSDPLDVINADASAAVDAAVPSPASGLTSRLSRLLEPAERPPRELIGHDVAVLVNGVLDARFGPGASEKTVGESVACCWDAVMPDGIAGGRLSPLMYLAWNGGRYAFGVAMRLRAKAKPEPGALE